MSMALRPAYLCVDEFMRDLVGARGLQSAFELGLVDHLLKNQPIDLQSAAVSSGLDARALQLLLGILEANGVIEVQAGNIALSEPFVTALRYRDLLQAKLDFAAMVAPDFLELFSRLLTEPEAFFQRARIFELFSYDRCLVSTPENLAATRRWMRFTTVLTRYEAQVCIERYDFSACRRVLDVGGNSGEFALHICRKHRSLRATVLDLPVVCEIGRTHLAAAPEAARIDFVETDSPDRPFPAGFDLVCFKSMLHDWPDAEMRHFLELAYQALDCGGRLLIFERGLIEAGAGQIPYSLVPIMLFFRSYRLPQEYVRDMEQIGFRDIRVETIELEMPFMLISAQK